MPNTPHGVARDRMEPIGRSGGQSHVGRDGVCEEVATQVRCEGEVSG